MEMRGLHNFIAEVRGCHNNREQESKRINEELSKIKAKFKGSSLGAYDKKKYVCKLMFIQMLGYPVNFGQMEGVELLSGKSQSEKLIGYLSVAVFLHENHELTPLVTHTVNLDLVSGKEFHMTLALAAISNIGGRDFAEVMSSTVQKILSNNKQVGGNSSGVVKKKALLTALRLFRKYPEVLSVDQLLPIAITNLNTTDMGVMNCSLSLIMGLLKSEDCSIEVLAQFATVPECAIKIMHAIIGPKKITPLEYMYYGVPAPWIQMKCLRLLQYFPIPEDPELKQKILTILSKIVALTGKKYKEAMQNERKKPLQNQAGAMVAVITELVGVAVQWDCDAQLLTDITDLLSVLIRNEKSPNYRYTGLKLMTRLSFCSQTSFQFEQKAALHQQQVVIALRDPDISIRRAALDVLYCMCSKGQADEIVGELLLLVPVVDRQFRQDLVLMVAVIAEKFCSDYTWYVEVILSVITHAGDEVAADIWQRLCHIVVNTESVQKQAAETVLRALLSQAHASQVLVQVAAFLLGEFGYQIAISPDCHPMQQFSALQTRFTLVDTPTKCMLLTTYVKFYNLYDNPAVREKIKKALSGCLNSMDPEIQQRAAEYTTLITTVSDSILQECLEPMLPFTITSHSLLDRLTERQRGTDRNLWSEKAQQRDMEQINATSEERQKNAEQHSVQPEPTQQEAQDVEEVPLKTKHKDPFDEEQLVEAKTGGSSDPMDALMGPPRVNLSNAPTGSASASDAKPAGALDDIFAVTTPPKANLPNQEIGTAANPSIRAMNDRHFPELCVSESGTLYEDTYVNISVNPHQYRNADGRLNLVVTNKSQTAELAAFNTKLVKTSPNLIVQNKPHENVVPPGGQVIVFFAARAVAVYDEAPELQLSWMCGGASSTTLTVPLPLVTTRFISPYQLDDSGKFTALWDTTPSTVNPALGVVHPIPTQRPLEVSDLERTLFQKCKCQTLRPSADVVFGVGAHAVQPEAACQFTPVMVHLGRGEGNTVMVAVKTPNPVLQKQLYNVVVSQLKLM